MIPIWDLLIYGDWLIIFLLTLSILNFDVGRLWSVKKIKISRPSIITRLPRGSWLKLLVPCVFITPLFFDIQTPSTFISHFLTISFSHFPHYHPYRKFVSSTRCVNRRTLPRTRDIQGKRIEFILLYITRTHAYTHTLTHIYLYTTTCIYLYVYSKLFAQSRLQSHYLAVTENAWK